MLDSFFVFNSHLFRQTRLFNVLKGYSRYDRVLGYCQGIGMIVAVLLTYVTEEVRL
jgi:hypothetical protein